jgi:hypothetical protein
MNPRIYNFTSVDPKTGKQTTSQHRQKDYRRAIAAGFDKAHGGVKAWRKFQLKRVDRMYAFFGIHDFALATKAYKASMMEFHPDRGGNAEEAARINAEWDKYKKLNGWE